MNGALALLALAIASLQRTALRSEHSPTASNEVRHIAARSRKARCFGNVSGQSADCIACHGPSPFLIRLHTASPRNPNSGSRWPIAYETGNPMGGFSRYRRADRTAKQITLVAEQASAPRRTTLSESHSHQLDLVQRERGSSNGMFGDRFRRPGIVLMIVDLQ